MDLLRLPCEVKPPLKAPFIYAIPDELLVLIASFVKPEGLLALRLSTRRLSRTAFEAFAKEYLKHLSCYFQDPARVDRIINLSSNPDFAREIQRVNLTNNPTEHRYSQDFHVAPHWFADHEWEQGLAYQTWARDRGKFCFEHLTDMGLIVSMLRSLDPTRCVLHVDLLKGEFSLLECDYLQAILDAKIPILTLSLNHTYPISMDALMRNSCKLLALTNDLVEMNEFVQNNHELRKTAERLVRTNDCVQIENELLPMTKDLVKISSQKHLSEWYKGQEMGSIPLVFKLLGIAERLQEVSVSPTEMRKLWHYVTNAVLSANNLQQSFFFGSGITDMVLKYVGPPTTLLEADAIKTLQTLSLKHCHLPFDKIMKTLSSCRGTLQELSLHNVSLLDAHGQVLSLLATVESLPHLRHFHLSEISERLNNKARRMEAELEVQPEAAENVEPMAFTTSASLKDVRNILQKLFKQPMRISLDDQEQ